MPGRFYDMTFDLQPDDQVIPVGQQIGLMIMSSDREFTLRPDPGTELAIDLDETSIQLHLVGGVKAFAKAVTKKAPKKKDKSKKTTSSTVSNSVSYVVKDTDRGELHYTNVNGETVLKVISSGDKVVFDGPINTKKQKAKVPREAMKWYEEVIRKNKEMKAERK